VIVWGNCVAVLSAFSLWLELIHFISFRGLCILSVPVHITFKTMTFRLTMIFRFGLLLCFFFSGVVVLGNVEKAIFLGPERTFIPTTPPTLEDLRLDVLTPGPHRHNWWLRAQLSAQFPSPDAPKGASTWLLLDNLVQGQRYEVRVCWPATVSPPCLSLS
jgi:hypothetical protein